MSTNEIDGTTAVSRKAAEIEEFRHGLSLTFREKLIWLEETKALAKRLGIAPNQAAILRREEILLDR